MIYQAGHIFLVARRTYKRSIVDSSEAMPSIILSTVALECFVNETIERLSKQYFREADPRLDLASNWLEFIELKKGSTLEKLEAFHLVFRNKPTDRGCQPYQDISFLYQLRNELVHKKPEPFGDWDPNNKERIYEPHKFVRTLVHRGIVTKPPPNLPPIWSQFILHDRTAKWAFNTAVLGVQFVVSLLPEGVFSKITSQMADQINPIA